MTSKKNYRDPKGFSDAQRSRLGARLRAAYVREMGFEPEPVPASLAERYAGTTGEFRSWVHEKIGLEALEALDARIEAEFVAEEPGPLGRDLRASFAAYLDRLEAEDSK